MIEIMYHLVQQVNKYMVFIAIVVCTFHQISTLYTLKPHLHT